ncbi:MAG: hypothetical protein V1798_04705 [Pseudomonadota bacterium]
MCLRDDARETYKLTVQNEGIAEPYIRTFERILTERNTNAFFAQYSTKPTDLRITYDPDADRGGIRLHLRFLPAWYRKMTASFPTRIGNVRVATFRPYFDVMKELLALREVFSKSLPAGISESVLRFQIVLALERPCGEFLEFAVVAGRQEQVLDPYFLSVKVKGYDEATVEAADKSIFDDTGMFALGPAKLLSGDRTDFTVVYDFLEIQP